MGGRTGPGGINDRWQVLWKDWSWAGRRRGDPRRYRVDDGAAACRRRRLGWGWDQPRCRRWDRARRFCSRRRAFTALQSVLLPIRLLRLLLPTRRVLSAGGEL